MTRRLFLLAILLIALNGCGEDTQMPSDRTPTLQDLRLTTMVSADTIVRGDTLHIYMEARNPYRKPLDVEFPSSCQEAFWVYDAQGRDVSPIYGCWCSTRPFHMDPLETRQFHFKWRSCTKAGLHTVVAGFRPLIDEAPHSSAPIPVEVLPSEENVTGEWWGSAFDLWGLPDWDDYGVSLVLEQLGTEVLGTFAAGGPEYEIESGEMVDEQLGFTIKIESAGVQMRFVGYPCGSTMGGTSYVLDLVTSEVLVESAWFVTRAE